MTMTMRAARLDEVGPPENVKIVDCPMPVPGPGDVLIKVAMAGLIYGDAEARRGTYFGPTVVPWFPGREVAGEVVVAGANVEGWHPGDRIVALVLTQGCCAEYVLASTEPRTLPTGKRIPPADIQRLPGNVSYGEALVYLINFRLAHLLFHGSSRVPSGATVLIHGASGGMGTMLVQLAKSHGCTVIGTCLRLAEERFLTTLGADHVINVTECDYTARVRELTGGKGVLFVFNGVGGDTINTDVEIMAPFGELQAYGYVAGKKPFDVFRVPKTIALKTFAADDFFITPMFPAATEAMHDWFRSRPLLQPGLVLPLSQISEAMRRLDRGDVLGKIVLQP
ncbi:MAG: quinone oxidoreductase family protein [Chloroflexota bacterium]